MAKKYSFTEKRQHKIKILVILFFVFFIFCIYSLITSFIIRTYKINSDTMEPIFSKNDVVLTSFLYTPESSVKRADIVVISPLDNRELSFFKKTINEITAFFTFQLLRPFDLNRLETYYSLRRVIGLPGDTVYMENFILHIKTKDSEHFLTEFELTDTDYDLKLDDLPENWNSSFPFSGSYPKITLKENEFFVLCDNRIASDDSRMWGVIDGNKRIKGKVVFKYWPFNSFKIF